jgi:hypothetical protein
MIKKSIKKKGMSHVEVIVSFALFIGFILFLFIYFNPFNNSVSPGNSEVLKKNFLQETEIPVVITKIIINKSSVIYENCFAVSDIEDFSYTKPAVFSENEKLNSTVIGNNLYVHKKKRVYDIYFSDFFSETYVDRESCLFLSKEEYSFGVTREKNIIFLNKLEEFQEKYNSDYSSLKQEIGFIKNRDFGFVVRKKTGEEISAGIREVPSGVDVNALGIDVEIINEKGEIAPAFLNLQVW